MPEMSGSASIEWALCPRNSEVVHADMMTVVLYQLGSTFLLLGASLGSAAATDRRAPRRQATNSIPVTTACETDAASGFKMALAFKGVEPYIETCMMGLGIGMPQLEQSYH